MGAESVIYSYGMKDDEISPKEALQIRQFISAIKGLFFSFRGFKGNCYFSNIITVLMVIIGSFVVATQPDKEEELTNVTNSVT
ncbi:hypothetical protein ACSW82_02885 [Clostridium perfringens]